MKGFLTVLVFLIGVNVPGVVFAQSHAITSANEMTSFTDPGTYTWGGADLESSLVLSWTEGSGGFCNAVVFAPLPGGGRYVVTLDSVVESNASEISGVWTVVKNGITQPAGRGRATGLNGIIGEELLIVIGDWQLKAKISYKIDSRQAPETVKGIISVDDETLAGATAKLRTKNGTEVDIEKGVTESDGKFGFDDVTLDTFKKVTIRFKNFDNSIVIAGHIYVEGQPLVNAPVTISNTDEDSGNLAVVYTDGNGYYNSGPIIGATGRQYGKIKIVIQKPE
jgi:hypothetical protein